MTFTAARPRITAGTSTATGCSGIKRGSPVTWALRVARTGYRRPSDARAPNAVLHRSSRSPGRLPHLSAFQPSRSRRTGDFRLQLNPGNSDGLPARVGPERRRRYSDATGSTASRTFPQPGSIRSGSRSPDLDERDLDLDPAHHREAAGPGEKLASSAAPAARALPDRPDHRQDRPARRADQAADRQRSLRRDASPCAAAGAAARSISRAAPSRRLAARPRAPPPAPRSSGPPAREAPAEDRHQHQGLRIEERLDR